jgi:hypothetical protein
MLLLIFNPLVIMKSFTHFTCSKQVKSLVTSIVFILSFSISINAQSQSISYSLSNLADQSAGQENMVATNASIKFNPIGIAQGILKIKMFDQPDGIYTVQLLDSDGKVLGTKQIHHTEDTKLEIADFGKNFAGGTYLVEVINPDNIKTTQTIMLLI